MADNIRAVNPFAVVNTLLDKTRYVQKTGHAEPTLELTVHAGEEMAQCMIDLLNSVSNRRGSQTTHWCFPVPGDGDPYCLRCHGTMPFTYAEYSRGVVRWKYCPHCGLPVEVDVLEEGDT